MGRCKEEFCREGMWECTAKAKDHLRKSNTVEAFKICTVIKAVQINHQIMC